MTKYDLNSEESYEEYRRRYMREYMRRRRLKEKGC